LLYSKKTIAGGLGQAEFAGFDWASQKKGQGRSGNKPPVASKQRQKQGLPSLRSESRLSPPFGKTLRVSGSDVAAAKENDDLCQLKFV
jgi:hypothetical protein